MMCCGRTGRDVLIFDILKSADKSVPVISETIISSNQYYKMKIFRLNDMLQYIAKWFCVYQSITWADVSRIQSIINVFLIS